MTQTTDFLPPYEGDDMAGYIMEKGFKFAFAGLPEKIVSIANVRDTAIIVTDYSVYRAKPCYQVGFSVECLARF